MALPDATPLRSARWPAALGAPPRRIPYTCPAPPPLRPHLAAVLSARTTALPLPSAQPTPLERWWTWSGAAAPYRSNPAGALSLVVEPTRSPAADQRLDTAPTLHRP